MASLDPLETLRMDTTCSICLEYLMDPVTIGCGHSFCRVCIHRCWEPGTHDFLCPVCRKLCAQHVVVPSRQLASVVEIAKQLHSPKRKVLDEPLCPQHHEMLHFFCKEDQEAMCLVCAVSHGDRAHSVGPLDDAIVEYKSKLQDCQLHLDVKLQEVNKRISTEERRPQELRELVKSRRQRIICDFEELRSLLEEEKEAQLRRLKAEEAEILEKLKDGMALLSEQRLSLSKLITDMGEKCLESGTEMLKDVQIIMQRYETSETIELPSVSLELKRTMEFFPRQFFTLTKLLKKYSGDMTLDPETAHPNLMLSENLKSVHFINICQVLPDTPRRFTIYPCVLGSAAYISGRHYWEVDVGNKTQWALGVCYESVSRKAEIDTKPETGYWRVRLWNGKYAATTTPFTLLHLRVKPKRVGVFLDYEAGKVSFYNVTDHSHIYTFSVEFAEPVCPLFYPGIRFGHVNAAPLVICQPLDWD
ncbi:E3 ubiquitin-protein ligase TRIM39-like [Emydura macquarii macquarii]|uniref:E3 ubiquitin-protein ligase TRIM39-like n=1 Tax=Emydura macquarii macquarii TaxID=1129001 RepID=UPI00352B39AF